MTQRQDDVDAGADDGPHVSQWSERLHRRSARKGQPRLSGVELRRRFVKLLSEPKVLEQKTANDDSKAIEHEVHVPNHEGFWRTATFVATALVCVVLAFALSGHVAIKPTYHAWQETDLALGPSADFDPHECMAPSASTEHPGRGLGVLDLNCDDPSQAAACRVAGAINSYIIN